MGSEKKVGHLKDLLRDLSIPDVAALKKLITGQSHINNGDIKFTVLRPDDLPIDAENRYFGDEFVFERTIFDCTDIRLRNSTRIRLHDCVFLGSLMLGNKEGETISISINTSAFTGDLDIVGADSPDSSFLVTDVRAPRFRIDSIRGTEIALTDNVFKHTTLSRLTASTLRTFGNQFGVFESWDVDIDKVSFPPRQVDLKSQRSAVFGKFSGIKTAGFNPLDYRPLETLDDWMDRAAASENTLRSISSLEFLATKTDVPHSKLDASTLKYLRAIAESQGRLSRGFVWITGAFIKPVRFVLLSVLAITIFAGLYCGLRNEFTGAGIGSFWDALYFSGVTFTTIGYGDILPTGFARAGAVIEGLLGISLSSAFVVSIVRRYIE